MQARRIDASRSAASEVVVEAGSTPGTTDLAQLRVGTDATSLIVANERALISD